MLCVIDYSANMPPARLPDIFAAHASLSFKTQNRPGWRWVECVCINQLYGFCSGVSRLNSSSRLLLRTWWNVMILLYGSKKKIYSLDNSDYNFYICMGTVANP